GLPTRVLQALGPGRDLSLDHSLIGDDADLEGVGYPIFDSRPPQRFKLRFDQVEQFARPGDPEHRHRRAAGQRRYLLDKSRDSLVADRIDQEWLEDAGNGAGDICLDLAAGPGKAIHDRARLLVGPFGPLLAKPDRATHALLRQLGIAFREPGGMTATIG